MTTTYDVPSDPTEAMLLNRAKFAAKLAKAQAEMPPIEKDKTHQQGYKFQSADSIFAVCRPLLARCGLALLPSVISVKKEVGQTGKGTPFVLARAKVMFTLIDTGTGYGESGVFYGDALDYNGMEVQKAMTIAAKLFLKSLFLISEAGDDPDEDDHDAPPPAVKSTPSPAKPAPKAETRNGKPAGPSLASAAQRNRITELAGKLHYTVERLGKVVQEEYGVEWEKLSEANAAQLIQRLEKAEAAAKQKATAQGG